MRLIHNERTKLTAAFLKGVAIAVFAVGALAPLVGFLTGNGGAGALVTARISASCVAASVSLHWTARWFLGSLGE